MEVYDVSETRNHDAHTVKKIICNLCPLVFTFSGLLW